MSCSTKNQQKNRKQATTDVSRRQQIENSRFDSFEFCEHLRYIAEFTPWGPLFGIKSSVALLVTGLFWFLVYLFFEVECCSSLYALIWKILQAFLILYLEILQESFSLIFE